MRLLILFLVLSLLDSYGQEDIKTNDLWMLEEVIKDSVGDGIIFNRWNGLRDNLLRPEIRKYSSAYLDGFDDLIMKGGRLFLLVDGTGRVYEAVRSEPGTIRMIRRDSTLHTGHNFGAINFVFQDTIFSAGGYGFWNRPGNLRYYDEKAGGWEIKPLNRLVKSQNQPNQSGYFISDPYLYHVTTGYPNQALKPDAEDQAAQITDGIVYRLNLNSKDWEELGKATSEYLNLKRYKILTFSPWGPLVYMGPPLNTTLYLLDYSHNKILELRDPKKAATVISSTWLDNLSASTRMINYWKDSTLIVLSSEHTKSVIRLTYADFKTSGWRIHEEIHPADLSRREILFPALFFLIAAAAYYFYRKKRTTSNTEEGRNLIFDRLEIILLKGFLNRENHTLLIEEVDELLETGRKSKDVQNQKRSVVTRSINQKYSKLTGDDEKLITAVRMEIDRRNHCYVLDYEKFIRIADWLSDAK